jgi:hypothetical protein
MPRIRSSRRPVGKKKTRGFHPGEDWLSVILAFILILLCVIGVLGPKGLPIPF